MARVAPTGRERELGQLLGAAQESAGGGGSVVFLSGPTGAGKSFLLKAFADELATPELSGRADFVSVLCYETSAGNPLGPFGEVLRALTSRERRGDRAKRVLELVGQVAPPLVELIPIIGKLAALGVKTAAEVGVYALGGSHEAQQAQLAVDVANALRHVADDRPLVVVIDDAHWIDAPSTEVIVRLAQGAGEHALLLVVAYDADLVDDRHPLARARAATAGRPGVHDVVLTDLDEGAVESLLREHYGAVPGGEGRLAAWLHDRTDGSPLFLVQYLATLEEQGVIRRDGTEWILEGTIEGEPGNWTLGGALAGARTPDSLLELLRPRIADLDEDERVLLETGAVQGRRFLSTVLVRLLDREEDEILDRLAHVAEWRRMIASEAIEDWWSDRSALYAFDPSVLQELLYGRYAKSPYERKRRHRAVAEALEELIAGDDPPPRAALLEIARHYREAGRPLDAATRLVMVADSTFAEGADRETAAIAERAAELVRAAAPEKLEGAQQIEAQRLLARAILLQLLGRDSDAGRPDTSSLRSDGASGGERLLALAAEAEHAAEAAGDAKLKANARFATAVVLTSFSGLDEGIAAYRQALELARAADDPLAEFAILITFGHHLDSVSLQEGWEVLNEARALLTEGALAAQLSDARQVAERAALESTLGVAAFDLGRYGEALELLTGTPKTLLEAHRREEAGWALSYLAQVLTAIGAYEQAEQALDEALALFDGTLGQLGLRAYLRALLGRLSLEREPPRPDEARTILAAAREEASGAGFRPVIPLVECCWGELLLAEQTPASLLEAERTLEAVCTFGWARSEITARSLRARVALADERVGDAVELSTSAVTELSERGGSVPTVRSEEILFWHARALEAAGSTDAASFMADAAKLVHAKAESLTDPAQKESFLTRVRLSREILAAV